MTPVELAAGAVLMGRYTLTRRLGRGLGGETWLAQGPGGEVAIKVLGAQEDPGGRRQGDLLREASLLRGLEHPHVVGYRGIHDLAEEGWTLLVTDFVPGGDLEALVSTRGAPFGVAETARLGLQLVDAVAALHARRCLHRDLKPSNVLVGEGEGGLPCLRIADFGISRSLVDGRALPSQPLGSLGYAAPEQYEAGELTPAADRFALGGVLLFLATGHHPPPLAPGQRAGLVRALLQRAQGEKAPGASGLAGLVERLMAGTPGDRPDLEECRIALAALADGRASTTPEAPPAPSGRETLALDATPPALVGQPAEAVPAVAPATRESPARPSPLRRRLPMGTLAALALLLAAATTWAVLRGRGAAPEASQEGDAAPSLEIRVPAPSAGTEDPLRAEDRVAPVVPAPVTPEPELPPPGLAPPAVHGPEVPAPTPVGAVLTVSSRPTGATITLDGWERGSTPATLPIPAGGAIIGLELENHPPLRARCEAPLPEGALLCWDFRVEGPCRRSVMNCEPIQ